jgi:hypothetical protein
MLTFSKMTFRAKKILKENKESDDAIVENVSFVEMAFS